MNLPAKAFGVGGGRIGIVHGERDTPMGFVACGLFVASIDERGYGIGELRIVPAHVDGLADTRVAFARNSP